MKFADPNGHIHTLNAHDALELGLDLKRMVHYATLHAIGYLSDDPATQILKGEKLKAVLEFMRVREVSLMKEAGLDPRAQH